MLKKSASPGSIKELPNRTKVAIVSALSGQFPLAILLECVALARSSYYYLLSHPLKPTRPELHEAVKEIFSRTQNGCGHRQIAMALRAESGVKIANKTVLKIMHELNLHCRIRKVRAYTKYNSYRGEKKNVFDNILKRDFNAMNPWEKLGTDVTEFHLSWGKAYFAPIYDFASKEIVAWSISQTPTMEQQYKLLDQFFAKLPKDAHPILHSDRGWQYQHNGWCRQLKEQGIIQSMSRLGNCLDNAATEQVFGHLKDEFFRGQKWNTFEEFKEALNAYVIHWNTRRRQVKLKGLTPEEFRNQSTTI